MRVAAIAAGFMLVLAGCGDSSGGSPAATPAASGKDPSKMLTAPEIQEALRRSGRNPEEMARAMEAELKARLGSDYLASANKAKEMAERPLTAADVERYIELAPLLQPIRTDQAASEKLLTAHGTSQLEHAVLVGRIIAARMMLRIGKEPDDEKMKQTLELVRPYADRIDAATRAR